MGPLPSVPTAKQMSLVKLKLEWTFSRVGNSLTETACGAPAGTLTQLEMPASSIDSLSISPSTFYGINNVTKEH